MKSFNRLMVGIVLLLALTSCGRTIPADEAIFTYLSENAPRTDGGTPQLTNFRIHCTLPWSDGTAVFYTIRDVSSPSNEQVGYIIFERTLFRWKPKETGVLVRPTNSIAPDQYVEYVTGGAQQRNAKYALVVGRILNPHVAAIEARLDNKEMLRDTPTDDVFAMLSKKASAICEVRLLKANGEEIEKIIPMPLAPQCTT